MGSSPLEAELFAAFSQAQSAGKPGLLLAGPIGSGKTKAARILAAILLEKGFSVAGIVSPRILKAGETVGYVTQDIRTGKTLPLCAKLSPSSPLGGNFSLIPPSVGGEGQGEGEIFRFRRFFFSRKALDFANSVLEEAAGKAEAIVVDEVGPLELSGRGFAPGLQVCREANAFLILTVRPHLLSLVKSCLNLESAEILFLCGGR